MPREDTAALEARLDVLRALLAEGALPYNAAEAEAELARWQMAGYPACHHSADYRAAHHPAYRVLHRHYTHLLPLLETIDGALAARERVLLAIEGGAASGKTTLSRELSELYPDSAVFQADDFFLRPEQRTPGALRPARGQHGPGAAGGGGTGAPPPGRGGGLPPL